MVLCDTDKCCSIKGKGIAKITEKRELTDAPMLVLFVLSVAGLVLIYVRAQSAGADPSLIIHGYNMEGLTCGVGDLKASPVFVWPSLTQPQVTQCAAACSETNNPQSKIMAMLYPSVQFGQACIPNAQQVVNSSAWAQSFLDPSNMVSRGIADFETSFGLVLGSGAAAFLAALILVYLIKFVAATVIWGLLALTFVSMVALGAVLFAYNQRNYNNPTNLQDHKDMAQSLTVVSYIVWGIAVVFAVTVFFLRTQIEIAIEVVKQGSNALQDLNQLLFFPMLPIAVAGAYIVLWSFVAANVYSVMKFTQSAAPVDVLYSTFNNGARNSNPATYSVATWEKEWRDSMWYLAFHFLWQMQAVYYWGYFVVVGCIADWYFTGYDGAGYKKKGDGEGELHPWPVTRSMVRTILYHLGTLQLAAFILATVQFIRYTVVYLEKKSKAEAPNALQKCLFASLVCCLKCVECCLDKLNKNGLIWTAVYGDGFCTASCSAFALLWRNLARVCAINLVSTIIVRIGKLLTAFLVTYIFYMVMQNHEPWRSQLHSPFFPGAMIFAFSFFAGSAVFTLFEAILDCQFLCFLIDYEENGATGRMLASEDMQKIVGKYQDASEKRAGAEMKNRQERRKAVGYAEEIPMAAT